MKKPLNYRLKYLKVLKENEFIKNQRANFSLTQSEVNYVKELLVDSIMCVRDELDTCNIDLQIPTVVGTFKKNQIELAESVFSKLSFDVD